MEVAAITTVAVPPRRIDIAGGAERADTSTLGGRISFARLRKQLTQADMAKTLDKSRATVVQYEANNIMPPLDVVNRLAEILGVSPAFLAYGENTVVGLNKSVDMVTFAEHRVGKDGSWVDNAYAFNKNVVDEFGVEPGNFEAYVMNHDAAKFGIRSGDRVFIDKSVTEPTNDHETYLLKTAQGVEMVSVEPSLTVKSEKTVSMTTGKGREITAKLADLEFIGAVVATLRKM